MNIDEKFFTENTFRANAVDTKTFVLMLAPMKPLSLISGGVVGLEDVLRAYNRTEFHHLYPRAALKNRKTEQQINRLANFSFLSRADNNAIGGSLPSIYKAKLHGDVSRRLEHSLCPESLFEDDYEKFIRESSIAFGRSAQANGIVGKTAAELSRHGQVAVILYRHGLREGSLTGCDRSRLERKQLSALSPRDSEQLQRVKHERLTLYYE